MNKISYESKLIHVTLPRRGAEKPPRHCGVCLVGHMCRYDSDGFCFWWKEYKNQTMEED